jgi:hypothetical protein
MTNKIIVKKIKIKFSKRKRKNSKKEKESLFTVGGAFKSRRNGINEGGVRKPLVFIRSSLI